MGSSFDRSIVVTDFLEKKSGFWFNLPYKFASIHISSKSLPHDTIKLLLNNEISNILKAQLDPMKNISQATSLANFEVK